MNRQTILSVLVAAFVTAAATADTITVCWDGSGEYLTIQEGIDAANNGDEVVVCPGTYNELINFNGKAITLRSSDGPDVTTIDGTGLNNSVVKCVSGEGPDTVLEGFTVTGGTGDPSVIPGATAGGGMFIDASSPTLIDCRLTGNVATGHDGRGGGMFIASSNPMIIDCMISDNASQDAEGGGLYCTSSDLVTLVNCTLSRNSALSGGGIQFFFCRGFLVNCSFEDNSAASEGGGALFAGFSNNDATLVNCVFSGNTANVSGGAISSNDSGHPTLINCTLIGNSGPAYGAIHTRGSALTTVVNCILWNNGPDAITAATATYSNIEGGWPGTGNIDVDPRFVNAASGNFRLAADSPCIDAGDNTAVPPEVTTDLSGNPRFVDDPNTPDTGNGTPPIVDMGPYERQLLGDLNCDGTFNGADIDPFFLVLGDTVAYIKAFPNCDFSLACQ